MEEEFCPETSLKIEHTVWSHIPRDNTLHVHSCESENVYCNLD
jgi:hypothetical protein